MNTPKFSVILHKQDENDKNAYFTHQNNIVPREEQGVWDDFGEAQKAAMRARLQDPLGRLVTVKEY